MGSVCSRNTPRNVVFQSAPAQQSTSTVPARPSLSWEARGISLDGVPVPPVDSLLQLSLKSILSHIASHSTFERLPQDLSQRIFGALVLADAENSAVADKDTLKKFRGCFLRDINLGTQAPDVNDTWVDDILAAGCGYVETLNIANSLITTRALQRILSKERNIRYLNLGRCKALDPEAFKSVGGLLKLEELVLEGNAQVTKSVLAHLTGLQLLSKLDISCSPNVTGGLAYLAGLTRLRTLRFGWCTRLNDSDLASLAGLTNLEELQLARTDISDAGLASLAGLCKLQSLDLGGCKISDEGVASLTGLASLTELKLDNCHRISDDALKLLSAIRGLRRLNCSYTGVTDAGVAALAALPVLSALSLDSCQVTDAGMAHIGQIRSLRELDLSDTAVGDAGMAHLRPLAGLESLNLSYSAVGDDGLRALRALPSLRNLNLDSRLVTDLGLVNLGPMPKLEELDLFGAKISDTGAAVIARQFRGLKTLEICGGGLTDAGVAQLAHIPTLKCLSVAQNRGVTDRSVPHLVRGLKKLSCLNLTHCRVTSAGATQLVKLNELRSLTLYDCKVSQMAVDTIRMQCPRAVILSNLD